jgi:hypothetical protein
MDISLRESLLSVDDVLEFQEDPTFTESFKANVGYLNMPLINTVEEGYRFATRAKDKNFKVAEVIPEDLLPHYKQLWHARDQEHYDFLEQNLRNSLQRKQVLSQSGVLPALAALPFDPLFFASFAPILNIPLKGKTLLQTTGSFAKQGAIYGTASEARRAPFDVNEDGEVITNIASSTILSGALGLGLKGVPALAKGVKSSVNKTIALSRGKQPTKFIDEDGNIKFSDETYTDYDKSLGDYDITTTDLIPTPTKSVLQDRQMPQSVKKVFSDIASNSSLTQNRYRKGMGEASVAQMIATHEGSAYRLVHEVDELYGRDLDIRNNGKFATSELSSDDWWEDTITRYINKDNPDPAISRPALNDATDAQKEAFQRIKSFFETYDQEARFVGLLLDDIQIKKLIKEIDDRAAENAKKAANIEANVRAKSGETSKQTAELKRLEEIRLADEARRIELEDILQSPTRKSFRWSIYYDRDKLSTPEGKQAFLDSAARSYARQRSLEPNRSFTSSVEEDALATYKKITQQGDEEMDANFSGGSKHLRYRKTNFEEWEIEPFILKGKDVIYSYAKRMGGRIEFARKFNNKSVDDILKDIEADMRKANMPDAKIAKTKASFVAEYERATGGLIKRADRWDNQLAMMLKNYSAWVYLPLAGISAVGDIGTILLQHGLKDSIKGGKQALSNLGYRGEVIKQARFAGDLMESIRGDAHRRLIGDTMQRIQPNGREKFFAKGNKLFYTANLLQPITMMGKTLDHVLVNDKFYKLSRNYKSISKYDKEYLARYGITEEDAAYYAKMPFSKADNGNFYYANTSEWAVKTAKEVEMLRKWQAATNAHANNSVIFGQQFDIPLIANGVVYAKDNPFFAGARKLFPNLYKIDEKVSTANTKLVRLESQLMTLPFTFMNFAFAANNKVLGRIRDPNQQHRLTSVVSLIALSYLALELKKPAWWFKDKDEINLGLRIIDHSGVTGLYSDLGYMGLHMAAGTGLYDMEKGLIKGKYTPDSFDSVLEPFGAPIGLTADYGRSAYEFMNGDYSEGTDRLVNSLPFIGLPYIFGDTKSMLKDLGR